MKLTRRKLAQAILLTAPALRSGAQAPADFTADARANSQRNRDALAKIDLPQSTEPAFVFKA